MQTKITKIIAISILFFIGFSFSGNAQTTIKVDNSGNYVAVKDTVHASSAQPTGKTFTDTKGNSYPVMVSKNGKLFVVRTSKTGNRYNQYLKL